MDPLTQGQYIGLVTMPALSSCKLQKNKGANESAPLPFGLPVVLFSFLGAGSIIVKIGEPLSRVRAERAVGGNEGELAYLLAFLVEDGEF
jgi:hypothetical protein